MRVHYWSFLLNEEGQPIENAEVWVYLAGGSNVADLYSSTNGAHQTTPYQLTRTSYRGGSDNIYTDANGYFEFWIGDASEPNGYTTSQKFKIKWYKAGISEGQIDDINILTYSDGQGFEWRGSWTEGETYSEYDLVTNVVDTYINTFNCTSSHIATTLTEPGSGASWENAWDYFSTGNTSITFLSLSDAPDTFNTVGALYNINAAANSIQETNVVLTEGINTFSITNGTSSLDIAAGKTLNVDANLTVESASIVNQDLTMDASVNFTDITLGSGTDINEFSTDGTLVGDSDNAVPTEKAVKTYVAAEKLFDVTNNTNTTINLTTADTGKTILVDNASPVAVNLPSVVAGDIGIWFKIHKIGVGNLTINRADSDTIESSTSVVNSIITETWANITIFLATATKWKFDNSPLGTWVTS